MTAQECEKPRELLPPGRMRRPREDDRRVPQGIVWKIRTGTAWRDVPERYGSWQLTGSGTSRRPL
ncbi:transposase [Nonomuraea africana]|uniref:transposase n=1 Tax=Nonomuraea africana TaxID=46171 RepID=UPI003B5B8D41